MNSTIQFYTAYLQICDAFFLVCNSARIDSVQFLEKQIKIFIEKGISLEKLVLFNNSFEKEKANKVQSI